jgi:hypothetical protein
MVLQIGVGWANLHTMKCIPVERGGFFIPLDVCSELVRRELDRVRLLVLLRCTDSFKCTGNAQAHSHNLLRYRVYFSRLANGIAVADDVERRLFTH